MVAIQLTKSSLGAFALEDESYYSGQEIEILEIPIDYKTWLELINQEPKCRRCKDTLTKWEKAILIQWYYENKKEGKISWVCWDCASYDI